LLKYEAIDAKDLTEHYEENEIKFSCPGVLCVLKEKLTGQILIVANSHFFWDPRFDFLKMH